MDNQRLLSLDVFRGITIAGMILVNNPGSWGHVYDPLLHAEWHGITPTDWVFPFFLFIVGVAIAYALQKRKAAGSDRRSLLHKVWIRTLVIFGIGFFLNLFPRFDFATVRIPGVLQRIALVYGITATLFLYADARRLFWIGAGCLLGYWVLMTLVPVPGGLAPNLEAETNLGAWLDRTLMSGHLWSQSKVWDPEGLLSTLPALATGISGILTGLWLRSTTRNGYQKASGMLAVGALLLALGGIWDWFFPINKKLWTSSYVVYMAGVSLLFLGAIYWLIDLKGYQRWTKPFVIYGTNALLVYVLSAILATLMYTIKTTGPGGEAISLQGYLWQYVLEPGFASAKMASLVYALANVLLLWLVAWGLYRRGIFIRV